MQPAPGSGADPQEPPFPASGADLALSLGSPLRLEKLRAGFRGRRRATEPDIEIVVHDFGVVSLGYRIALDGPLESLVDLACSLYDNAELRADSRRVVEAVLAEIRHSVRKPSLFDECEDYVVYEIGALDPPLPVGRLLIDHSDLIARILRSESHPLSGDEVADAQARDARQHPSDARRPRVEPPDGTTRVDHHRPDCHLDRVAVSSLRR